MQPIFLIATGGTIEKIYSEQTGAVKNVTCKIGEYLKRLCLPECDLRVIELMNKDSLEMTEEDRAFLVSKVTPLLARGCPIIVTHGTDTMVETGLYFQEHLPDLKSPIIFTGAMAPLGFEDSDGLQNLTESLLAAKLIGPAVWVVFHSQVLPVREARKDRERGTFVRIDVRTSSAEGKEKDEGTSKKSGRARSLASRNR